MKKPIFFILFASLAFHFPGLLHAQGTLQFNRVIYMSSGPLTVPSGKVWKIEKVMLPADTYIRYSGQTGGSCQCGSSSGYAHMNYTTTPIFQSDSNSILINSVEYNFREGSPLWLPAGVSVDIITITTPVQPSTPSSGCYCPYWIDGVWVGNGPYTPPQVTVNSVISIIEFNVIP